MAKKKKKEPKVEKVFDKKSEESQELVVDETKQEENTSSNIDDFLGKAEETPDDGLTENQRKKLERLDSVKSKISKILQSSNIEIVDENFGDEYESGSGDNVDGQSQQDYDSLKALFGGKDKNADAEVTLTIDDFDYTYIGQYLEEYDLMHMKNIKRVHIIRKKNPKLRKFLTIASIIIVVAVGSVLGFMFTRKKPVYLKNVTLNQTERVYYFNDKFDYTGLYLIAEYSDGKTQKIKLETSHFNNELSTQIQCIDDDIIFAYKNTANLVFTYQGFNVNYAVKVEKKSEKAIHALYTSGLFNIDGPGFITNEYLDFYIEYEDIGLELAEFSEYASLFTVNVDGVDCKYSKDGFKVENGTNESSVITISYGSLEPIRLDITKNFTW